MSGLSRRGFAAMSAGLLAGSGTQVFAQEDPDTETPKPKGPVEAAFERDYEAPSFKPSWKKKQINRQMAQDFVIYAHSDLKMVEKLLKREPGLINAAIDWGNGDFETALGGASHMGKKDIVQLLLKNGARIDIFCAAMMGLVDVVKAFITLEPSLIDANGPHGFSLHFHAQVGQEGSKAVLDYLQSVKEVKLRPVPWLRKKPNSKR
ncbi:MAG: ankyrin repeat domain-containing protein [Planctomycetaceae bacterium]